jgi:hypothetical protein
MTLAEDWIERDDAKSRQSGDPSTESQRQARHRVVDTDDDRSAWTHESDDRRECRRWISGMVKHAC